MIRSIQTIVLQFAITIAQYSICMINSDMRSSSLFDGVECCLFGSDNSGRNDGFLNESGFKRGVSKMNNHNNYPAPLKLTLQSHRSSDNISYVQNEDHEDRFISKVKISKYVRKGHQPGDSEKRISCENPGGKFKESQPQIAPSPTPNSNSNKSSHMSYNSPTVLRQKKNNQLEFCKSVEQKRPSLPSPFRCDQNKYIENSIMFADRKLNEKMQPSFRNCHLKPTTNLSINNIKPIRMHNSPQHCYHTPIYQPPKIRFSMNNTQSQMASPHRKQQFKQFKQFKEFKEFNVKFMENNSLIHKLVDEGNATGFGTTDESWASKQNKDKCLADLTKTIKKDQLLSMRESMNSSILDQQSPRIQTHAFNPSKIVTAKSLLRLSECERERFKQPKIEESMILIDFFNPTKTKGSMSGFGNIMQ